MKSENWFGRLVVTLDAQENIEWRKVGQLAARFRVWIKRAARCTAQELGCTTCVVMAPDGTPLENVSVDTTTGATAEPTRYQHIVAQAMACAASLRKQGWTAETREQHDVAPGSCDIAALGERLRDAVTDADRRTLELAIRAQLG